MFLIRLLLWLIRHIGLATFLSLLLLAIALGSLLQGLSSVIRGFDLWFIAPLVAAGALAGWGLAKLPLPGWLVGVIALAGGSEVVIIRLGRLAGPLLSLPKPLFDLVRQLPRSVVEPPELTPLLAHLERVWNGFSALLARLAAWLGALGGQPAYDPLATAFIWSLLLWGMAVWTAWFMRRQTRPLLALTPAGALLASVLAHSRESVVPLLLFLGATLLLMALVKQQATERYWQANQIDFSPEIRTDLVMTVLTISMAIVIIAASAPLLSIRSITQFSRNLFRDRIMPGDELAAQVLGLEINLEPATPIEAIRYGGLPRQHLLGAGPELSEQLVMVIRTNDPPPLRPDEPAPRYYWRSHTYDRYTGHGWRTGRTGTIDYQAGETIPAIDFPRQRLLRQTVRLSEDTARLLYAAGEVVRADQPFSVAWRSNDDIFGATTERLNYQVESRLPLVTATELRAAGSNYPAWIRRRYLSLPDSIPGRTLVLARDLSATGTTPYDRAKAIEGYLRTLPYTLDLPAPPSDQDVADYFLFDLRQGYCDYYATAMVVLARAAGLPARLAVGYINGNYDRTNRRYVVSEAEAHSWVEIYFPNIGWVTFEPTGGRPALERDETGAATVPPELERPPLSPTVAGSGDSGGGWRLALLGGLLLLPATVLAWSGLDAWRLRRLAPALAVAAVQQRLYRQAQRLRPPAAAGATPYEFAEAIIARMNTLATRKKWGRFLGDAPQEVLALTELYIRASYSPHPLESTDRRLAIRLWQRLRRRLWLAWLVGRG